MAPAESLITLALAIERENLDPADPARIGTLLTAANIAVAAARLPEGEQYSREALRIARASLPPGDPLLAESTRVLASLLRRQGKNEEAVEAYREYVDIHRRAHGENHPLTATAMVHLADAYQTILGRAAEAESMYRAAIGILEPAWACTTRDCSTAVPVSRGFCRIEERTPPRNPCTGSM
jgi:serine/threonine-protein kinase